MPDDTQEDQNLSVSVPVGVAATGLLLGVAAAAAYILIGRGDEASPSSSTSAKPGKGMLRRAGLMTLVTLIENDASRKVVVAILKMMARRS